mmetsp:Transcript_6287/g.19057  ORF Transcript_6287/g.19057 Transcript_6287/m.19057 type:complete len:236 (-) Transcript_6287:171-878(-)
MRVFRGRLAPLAAERLSSAKRASLFGGDLSAVLSANAAWVASKGGSSYFAQFAGGQKPRYLIIGCSDSRAPIESMMGFEPGEAFIHRNVANQVLAADVSVGSVLAFGVGALGVSDIIVCGHTECGGVKAGSSQADNGLLEHWLRGVRDLNVEHADELAAIESADGLDAKLRRLVDLNVLQQCLNVAANPVVQKTYAAHQRPNIHGLVYDVATGSLHDLKVHDKLDLPAPLDTGYL